MKKTERLKCRDKVARPIWALVNEKVYDLSSSNLWADGRYMDRYQAEEEDLADNFEITPHEDDLLERFALMGELESRKSEIESSRSYQHYFQDLYRKLHPHPMMIHFPIALFLFAAFMHFLFWITKDPAFQFSAFAALCVGTIGAFPATVAGICSWILNYERIKNFRFMCKLIGSGLLLLISLIAVGMGLFISKDSLLYQVCLLLNVPLVFFVAYQGGKITWPS